MTRVNPLASCSMRISVVVCGYNEEDNLPSLLVQLVREERDPGTTLEVICVLSGCTDRTVPRARALAEAHPEITIIEEPRRTGKAAALNAGLAALRGDVIFIINADTQPAPGFLGAVTRCLQDPEIALVCAHIVPVNRAAGITSKLGECLWLVHHEVCMKRPHAGEAFAFRGPGFVVPADVQDDDEYIQWWVTRQRGRAVYLPFPVVYNFAPSTFADYLRQRFRVARQYARLRSTFNGDSSSKNPIVVFPSILAVARKRPDLRGYLVPFTILEMCIAFMGRIASKVKSKDLRIWDPIVTTKGTILQAIRQEKPANKSARVP